jgi:hypothetical protein
MTKWGSLQVGREVGGDNPGVWPTDGIGKAKRAAQSVTTLHQQQQPLSTRIHETASSMILCT